MTGAFQSALMSDKITISINELRALLRKAFEGVFGHSRDWNAMTDTVIWLECHNHGGMALFFESYPKMHPVRKPALSETSANELVIEPNGAPLIEYVHLLSDVLLAAAQKQGEVKAQIQTVENVSVLESIRPILRQSGLHLNYTIGAHAVLLTVTPKLVPEKDDMERYYEILDKGFSLERSEYIKLCEYADKVLVPATEQSRRGAGE